MEEKIKPAQKGENSAANVKNAGPKDAKNIYTYIYLNVIYI